MPKRKKVKGNEEIVSEDIYAAEDETSGSRATLPEDIETEMEEGMKDEDVYSVEGREKLIDDREIEDWEEGFMEGAEGRGGENCCAYCGKLLGEEKEQIFEREFDDKIKLFCSEEHAQKFADRLEKEKAKRKTIE